MARGKKTIGKQSLEDPKDEYLSLFVKDGHDKVKGETIGVEGKEIVLKDGGVFLKVPLDALKLEDRILRIVKKIDWKKAKKKGQKWKDKELDPLQV